MDSSSSSNNNLNKTIQTSASESNSLPTEEERKQLEKIIEANSAPTNKNSSEYHLNRILNTKFLNPFEVLMLPSDATDDQIKRKYRSLTILIHPDKCKLPRASDAFHILEESYTTLMDPDKKRYFQRILIEAQERVQIARDKENKARAKKGLRPLPEENLENEIRTMIETIMNEIEEKKKYAEKMQFAYKKRERDQKEEEKEKEEREKKFQKEWESCRDKRVKNWNRFKSKFMGRKSRGKYEIKPPRHKTEERDEEQHIVVFRPSSII